MKKEQKKQSVIVLDDEEIIGLYWHRDEYAITQTDIKYKSYLFTVAKNVLNDQRDCEECISDTYLCAWNSIPPSRPRILKAFLTTIVRRIAINRYYSNNKKSNVPSNMTSALSEIESFLDNGSLVEQDYDSKRLGSIISNYLHDLNERQRYIFMSRYYGVNTVDKIASDLGLSRSTVNKELVVIRNGLRKKLESEGYIV